MLLRCYGSGTLSMMYSYDTLKASLAGIISFGRFILMTCDPVSISLLSVILIMFSKHALDFGFWHLPHSELSILWWCPLISLLLPGVCHCRSLESWIKPTIILLNFGTAPNQSFLMLAVSLLAFLTKLIAELYICIFNLITYKQKVK